ncbi:MAG: AsmA-like C-terminal region-containing protein [Anaeromyxobacter sp.]
METDRRPRRWPRILLIVLAVLVALLVAAVLLLDRIINSQVHEQTAKLSRELGRPIAVDEVSTRLLGGLGVKVTGVSVGAAEGEGLPLLELDRAEVGLALLRAIFSGGSDIAVREAVVEGLRVNVVKLPDGTTNVERLSKKLAERKQAQPEEAPEQPQGQGKALDIEVGRAAVENARIAFVDRTRPAAKELFVEDVDLEVRDVRAGRPLDLVLKAAVLAHQQNLELRVRSAPLPPSLAPVIEAVTLKVQPIDLDPLAPFLPASVGLLGGRFQADLAMALGAAVEGGKGPTTVKGGFKATQLAFAGQEGGKKLDAALDADLEADAGAGDLRIGKLELTAGPAALSGRGRVTGLRSETPKVEGLEVVSRGLDPEALAAYYPPLRKSLGGAEVAGPIGLSLRGEGTQAAQSVELRVDLGPVRLRVPQQLEKAAGAPMALTARASTSQAGRIAFDTRLDLAGADLRPGGALAKKPGDPLAVRVAGTYQGSGQSKEVRLSTVDLDLLGDKLAGTAQATLAGAEGHRTTTFQASLSGEKLDVDRLLLPSPAEKKKPEKAPASKPLDPKAFAGLSGVANLQLGLLRYHQLDLRDVLAKVVVKEDTVTLEQAQLQAFGGSVSAAGTVVRLAHPEDPFKVVAKLQHVQADQALGLLSDHKVLSGTMDLGLELGAGGMKGKDLLKTVTGLIQGNLQDGAFHGKDLVASVATPLSGMLPFAKKYSGGGSTSLGKALPFQLAVAGGVARLKQPLQFDTGQGVIKLDGGVRLDGSLDMPATLALSPELISKITGGKAKVSSPVPVDFKLAGAAWSPRLDGLALDGAAKTIASDVASNSLGKALGGLGLGGGKDEAAKPGEEGKAQPEQDAKKKLEEEAKKKLKGLFK